MAPGSALLAEGWSTSPTVKSPTPKERRTSRGGASSHIEILSRHPGSQLRIKVQLLSSTSPLLSTLSTEKRLAASPSGLFRWPLYRQPLPFLLLCSRLSSRHQPSGWPRDCTWSSQTDILAPRGLRGLAAQQQTIQAGPEVPYSRQHPAPRRGRRLAPFFLFVSSTKEYFPLW